ncbi:cytochrome c family protein [Maricaulaceae bacterium EIL42A08]|nr:cytochrome c family protein [Maricaulaceae bacterium EIL42A08]
MKTIKIFGVLIASAALTACGGGDGGDSSDTADAGSDAMETAAAAEENTMAEAPAPEPAPEPEPEPAPEPEAEAPAEEPAAAGGDDGAFMVAGLTGDAAAGRRIFARCQTCHVLAEGQNRVGPSLYGIFGREAGSVDGFRYSDANANSGITWTPEVMFEYLENPRGYIPGTTMAFPGLRSEQDRADVLAYIAANGGNG